MLSVLRRKFAAAGVLSALFQAAEAEARRDGQTEPGAEHFVLAALFMPDGGAARVFEQVGATAGQLRQAIARQYQTPLETLGVQVALASEPLPAPKKPELYRAAPSGQALIRALTHDRDQPLTSARVLAAAAEQTHGVLARALEVMGLDRERLRAAALAA